MNAIGYRLNIGYNHSTYSDLRSEKTMITEQDLNELRAEAIRTAMKADAAKQQSELAAVEMREALAEMGRRLGSMGRNQGDVAEEFFYNSLAESPTLGGIHYDFKDKSWRKRFGQVQDEFDIVLVNAEHVALIEVKYKAHANDLAKILDKKISNFKILFPEYANYQHHLGFASLHMNDELKQSALNAGVMVLQRKGDVMESFIPAA
jgi:Holliday junction resolvase-like predicted endonuclease